MVSLMGKLGNEEGTGGGIAFMMVKLSYSNYMSLFLSYLPEFSFPEFFLIFFLFIFPRGVDLSLQLQGRPSGQKSL